MKKILLLLSLLFSINSYTFASTNKYDVLTSGNVYEIHYRNYVFNSWASDCSCEIYSDSPDHYRARSEKVDGYDMTELLAIMSNGWGVSDVKIRTATSTSAGCIIQLYYVDFNCTDLPNKMNEDLHFADQEIIEDVSDNSWK